MGSEIEWRRDNITWKKVLGSRTELSGVRVWRAGPFSIHTLELWFKRQIFMNFIVDFIYKKGFLNRKFLNLWTILLRCSNKKSETFLLSYNSVIYHRVCPKNFCG